MRSRECRHSNGMIKTLKLTDTLKNRYFSNGEFGVMYDALRDDTMWQDASCVIPSTIDDPVYVLRDISGNNQHLTARDGDWGSGDIVFNNRAGRHLCLGWQRSDQSDWIEFHGV